MSLLKKCEQRTNHSVSTRTNSRGATTSQTDSHCPASRKASRSKISPFCRKSKRRKGHCQNINLCQKIRSDLTIQELDKNVQTSALDKNRQVSYKQDISVHPYTKKPVSEEEQQTNAVTPKVKLINVPQKSSLQAAQKQPYEKEVCPQNVEEQPGNGDSNFVIFVENEGFGTYEIPLSELSCMRLDDNGVLNLDTNSFNFIPSSKSKADTVDINCNVPGTCDGPETLSVSPPSDPPNTTSNCVMNISNDRRPSESGSADAASENKKGNMDRTAKDKTDFQSKDKPVTSHGQKNPNSVNDGFTVVQDKNGEYLLKVTKNIGVSNRLKYPKRTDYSQYDIPIRKPPAVTTKTSNISGSSVSHYISGPPVSSNMVGPPVSSNRVGLPVSSNMIGLPVSSNMIGPPVSSNMIGPPMSSNMIGPPMSSNLIGPPVSSNMFGPSVSSSMIGPPVTSSMIGPSVSSNMSGLPVSSNMSGLPVSSNMFGPPVSSSMRGPPVCCNISGPPVSSSMSCPPVSSNMIGPPVSSNMVGPTVSSNMSGPPVSSNMIGPPVSSNMSGLPVSSNMVGPPVSSNMSGPSVSNNVSGLPVSSSISFATVSRRPGTDPAPSTSTSIGGIHSYLATDLPQVRQVTASYSNDDFLNPVAKTSGTFENSAFVLGKYASGDPSYQNPSSCGRPSAAVGHQSGHVSMNNSLDSVVNPSLPLNSSSCEQLIRSKPSAVRPIDDGCGDFQDSASSLDYLVQDKQTDKTESGSRAKSLTSSVEILKPFCDCILPAYSPELKRALSFSSSGSQSYLMHASSVIIYGQQIMTFQKEGKLYVSVAELRNKNLISNFKRFSYLSRITDSVTTLNENELEFLLQKNCIANKKLKRCLSLDHLRWIYGTQALDQTDPFAITVAKAPWYVLRPGHWCPKVAYLKQTKEYVCPLCHKVEQRPIQEGDEDSTCAECSIQPETKVVAVSGDCDLTSAQAGQLQGGYLEIAGKYVCAYKFGDKTFVNCHHLMTYLNGFPWKNFVELAISLKVSFVAAPLPVLSYFTRQSYTHGLLSGQVWCSLQDLRCISCFSVGQMNNTDFLVKNQMLPLIAQHQYKEVFPMDAEKKRAITASSHQNQVPIETQLSGQTMKGSVQKRAITASSNQNLGPIETQLSGQIIKGNNQSVFSSRTENMVTVHSASAFSGNHGNRFQEPQQQRQVIPIGNQTQLPPGKYYVMERETYNDNVRDDGVVFRLKKQPSPEVSSTCVDLLSIATREIMTSTSSSNFTNDFQSEQMLEIVQTSNSSSLHSQNLPMEDMTPPERHNIPVEEYQNVACDSGVIESKEQEILSMPSSFFENNSQQTSKKKKHFLSPTKLGQLSAKGNESKETIVIQNESGEMYEFTPLCLVAELEQSGFLTPNKTTMKEQKPDTGISNPHCVVNMSDKLKAVSFRSENSPDSGISDERSGWCTPVSKSTGSYQEPGLIQIQDEEISIPDHQSQKSKELDNLHASSEQCAESSSSAVIKKERKDDSLFETDALSFDVSLSSDASEEPLQSVLSVAESLDTPFTSPSLPREPPSQGTSQTKKEKDKDRDSINLSMLASVADVASPYEVALALGDHDKSLESEDGTMKEQGRLLHSEEEDNKSERSVLEPDLTICKRTDMGATPASTVVEDLPELKTPNNSKKAKAELHLSSDEECSQAASKPLEAKGLQPERVDVNDSVEAKEAWNEVMLDLSEKSSDEALECEPKDNPCDASSVIPVQSQELSGMEDKPEVLSVPNLMSDGSGKVFEAKPCIQSVDRLDGSCDDLDKLIDTRVQNDLDKESENFIQLSMKLQDMIKKQNKKNGIADPMQTDICDRKKKHKKSKKDKKMKTKRSSCEDSVMETVSDDTSVDQTKGLSSCNVKRDNPHSNTGHTGQQSSVDDQMAVRLHGKKRKRSYSSKSASKKRRSRQESSQEDSSLDRFMKDSRGNVEVDKASKNLNENVQGAKDVTKNLNENIHSAKDSIENLDENAKDSVHRDSSVKSKRVDSASRCDEWWRDLTALEKVIGVLNRVDILFLEETPSGIRFQLKVDPVIYKVYGESEAQKQWLHEKLYRLVRIVYLRRKFKKQKSCKDSSATQKNSAQMSLTEISSDPNVDKSEIQPSQECSPQDTTASSSVSNTPSRSLSDLTSSSPCSVRDIHQREKSADSDTGYQTIEVMVECETEPHNQDSLMSDDSCEVSPGSGTH